MHDTYRDCPTCGVLVGAWCRTPDGTTLLQGHPERSTRQARQQTLTRVHAELQEWDRANA